MAKGAADQEVRRGSARVCGDGLHGVLDHRHAEDNTEDMGPILDLGHFKGSLAGLVCVNG